MAEVRNMWEGLFDFSFRTFVTARMLKFLYALHLLCGLVAAVAWVALGFQRTAAQGLVTLLAAVFLYFLWILYCRIALEVLGAVFRMAEAIAPERSTASPDLYAADQMAELR
ncbi:MAG TPA: DUF4282 domain-containing protein [Candidatus Acidoferrales bacterium]|nr:DUF4282 domain-containing protein [Candidatus Acidoferrales bacterium]